MAPIRAKSLQLTAYLVSELYRLPEDLKGYWRIITPSKAEERGAQVSILLAEGLLEGVMRGLEERGVLVDERRPDVIRVAPAALYNSFGDVLGFVRAFGEVLEQALGERLRREQAGGV